MALKSSAFYLVDPNMQHSGIVTHNLAKQDDKLYQTHYMHMDPLNPTLHKNKHARVIDLDSTMSAQHIEQLAYYQDFLKPMGCRHVADMFFRSDGQLIAMITLLRSKEQGAFTDEELALLNHLHPFLEYSLNTAYLPGLLAERKTLIEKYQLTAREWDVLEGILAGNSNKMIAKDMRVAISTVKTHLKHIFKKTASGSRTELIARVIAS